MEVRGKVVGQAPEQRISTRDKLWCELE